MGQVWKGASFLEMVTQHKMLGAMSTRDLVLLSAFVNALILGLILLLSKRGELPDEESLSSPPPFARESLSRAPLEKSAQEEPPSPPEIQEAPAEEWYLVKSGDNPWKIAKMHKIKFDDLLRLNGLNEEKARNLKPGERIRIR